jgi:ubiquinone/menaquinone biosynthesis C-methylase UbiE
MPVDYSMYRCPVTGEKLAFKNNALVSKAGHRFPVKGGIPDFTWPQESVQALDEARAMYEERADVYDKYLPLTFKTFYEDENKVRSHMIDKLNLKPQYRVLDIRDSINIAKRLSGKGSLYVQDLSPDMLKHAVTRLKGTKCDTHFSLANGEHLPFPDKFFDCAFSFGAMGEFGDKRRAFAELVRVTKPGGKIVVGDENLPVWLRGRTEFAKILLNYNKQYAYEVPFADLPVEARKVHIEWIIGGVFYLIDFEVGEGEPKGNFNFEIPGVRGGTHMTRYLGQLEGITPEAKKLAYEARKASGKSMHQWLDEVVKAAAKAELAAKPRKAKR